MRTAIVSDIHANLEALQSICRTVVDRRVDDWICLGDIVGYGADPGECLAIVRSLTDRILLGNHDAAVAGLQDVTYFNNYARKAVSWTRDHMPSEERRFLADLPLTDEREDAFYVHAEPVEPADWGYVVSVRDAATAMKAVNTRLCFVGHSHDPFACAIGGSKPEIVDDGAGRFDLEPNSRYLVNVGSVGQPRDGDPRACVVIHDGNADAVEFVRVEYDIGAAAAKIVEAGLPPFLAERLKHGH